MISWYSTIFDNIGSFAVYKINANNLILQVIFNLHWINSCLCVCACVCDLVETENKNPLIPGAEFFRTTSGIILMWLKVKFALNGLEIILHSRLDLNKFWHTGSPWTHCHTLAKLNSFVIQANSPGSLWTHFETQDGLGLTMRPSQPLKWSHIFMCIKHIIIPVLQNVLWN
jgi:hypothetical protein